MAFFFSFERHQALASGRPVAAVIAEKPCMVTSFSRPKAAHLNDNRDCWLKAQFEITVPRTFLAPVSPHYNVCLDMSIQEASLCSLIQTEC